MHPLLHSHDVNYELDMRDTLLLGDLRLIGCTVCNLSANLTTTTTTLYKDTDQRM